MVCGIFEIHPLLRNNNCVLGGGVAGLNEVFGGGGGGVLRLF